MIPGGQEPVLLKQLQLVLIAIDPSINLAQRSILDYEWNPMFLLPLQEKVWTDHVNEHCGDAHITEALHLLSEERIHSVATLAIIFWSEK